MDNPTTGSTETSSSTTAVSNVGETAQQPSTQQAEPTIHDFTDENQLIKIKGSDKPVKFGEHVKGLQSQWTKAAQEAKRLRDELQRERELRTRFEQERQAQAQRQQGPQNDVFESLRQLPYLSGKDAVEVVQSIGSEIRQRDQITLGILKQLQQMQQLVNGLQETHTTSSFENKIAKLLSDNGYSNDYSEIAKEIYLAYEGDDLDIEFPSIFESRINQLRKAFEAERLAKLREAKPKPFLPGRGGDGRPSKPLEVKPDASAKEIADLLWPQFQGNET